MLLHKDLFSAVCKETARQVEGRGGGTARVTPSSLLSCNKKNCLLCELQEKKTSPLFLATLRDTVQHVGTGNWQLPSQCLHTMALQGVEKIVSCNSILSYKLPQVIL